MPGVFRQRRLVDDAVPTIAAPSRDARRAVVRRGARLGALAVSDSLQCFYMTSPIHHGNDDVIAWRCKAPATVCLAIDDEQGHVPLCDDHALVITVRLRATGHNVAML